MAMHTAFEPRTFGSEYRFRKFSALVRRLAGVNGWYHVSHSTAGYEPSRTVSIFRGESLMAHLRVPAEALPECDRR